MMLQLYNITPYKYASGFLTDNRDVYNPVGMIILLLFPIGVLVSISGFGMTVAGLIRSFRRRSGEVSKPDR